MDGFEELLAGGRLPQAPRRDRAEASQEAFDRVQRLIEAAPPGPSATRPPGYATDRLGAATASAGASASVVGEASRKILGAGDRLERDFLAICAARPGARRAVPERARRPPLRQPAPPALRAYLAGEGEADEELVGLRAELDATVADEGLDEDVARELFLRLEERLVRRELADLSGEDLARTVELQGVLARIRDALRRWKASFARLFRPSDPR